MNQDYLKHQMLQLLIIISAFIFGFQTSEVYDEKYSLSTTGSPEHVSGLEDAQNKCVDSWLLEIYDENVATLLKKLNLNIQQNGILLGMKRDSNSWRWSDGRIFIESIIDQSETTVVACIGRSNNQVQFFARTIFDSAGVICSTISTEDKCAEWFYNGMCYFKPTTTTYQWFEAHNVCIKNGASMATFNNSETNFDMSFIGDQQYWVSLSRSTWMWKHSGEAVTFNKWSIDQPVLIDYQYYATTNSDGNEWKPVACSGTYHIVCMREKLKSSTTQPGTNNNNNNNNVVATTSKYEPSEDSLSIGAKVGIGVGVSMLLIIIIISGVLGFKYFHQFKTKSQSEIKSQDIYEKPDSNNSQNHVYQELETK